MIAALLGWVGTIGTMAAYVLMTRGKLVSTSRTYAAMNVAGGLLAGVSATAYAAWPSVASNLVWAGVGAWSLRGALRVAGHDRATHSAQLA